MAKLGFAIVSNQLQTAESMRSISKDNGLILEELGRLFLSSALFDPTWRERLYKTLSRSLSRL